MKNTSGLRTAQA